MCTVLAESGLVAGVRGPKTGKSAMGLDYIKQLIVAYSPIGLPIILGLTVPKGKRSALHVVAVCGYRINTTKKITANNDGVSWFSSNISKIYAHDDQWGPFARIEFRRRKIGN